MNSSLIPEWDSFATIGDDANGRIPCTRIEHWSKLFGIFDGPFFNRMGTELVFRGQRRHDWTLLPSLGRVAKNGLITKELAIEQLSMFRLAVRGRLDDCTLYDDDQDDELWAIGQHHGLMTPLLDWTDSPYVALFFAFSTSDPKGEKDNPYRAIYVLNKSYIKDKKSSPEIRFLAPRKDAHGRLVNQAGSFIYSPYEKTIEDALIDSLNAQIEGGPLADAQESQEASIIAEYICKIYVKNVDVEGCLRHLRKMNVHHASLFPDLIGAAEYCNSRISESGSAYVPQATAAEIEAPVVPADMNMPMVSASGIDESAGAVPADDVKKISSAATDELPTATSLNQLLLLHAPGFDDVIIEKLSDNINSLLCEISDIPDWQIRETTQAAIRTKLRTILRKFDFPRTQWDRLSRSLTAHIQSGHIKPEANDS